MEFVREWVQDIARWTFNVKRNKNRNLRRNGYPTDELCMFVVSRIIHGLAEFYRRNEVWICLMQIMMLNVNIFVEIFALLYCYLIGHSLASHFAYSVIFPRRLLVMITFFVIWIKMNCVFCLHFLYKNINKNM